MQIFDWPPELCPRLLDVRLESFGRVSNQALDGTIQTAGGGAQLWRVTLDFPRLSPENVKRFRALVAKLRGTENAVRYCLRDNFSPHIASAQIADVPFSDETDFSDTTVFAHGVETYLVSATKGARSIDLDVSGSETWFSEGYYFSISDDLHLITSVSFVGSVATIEFEPALRRNYVNGVFTFNACGLFRLTDNVVSLPLDYGQYGAPQIELIEAPI